MPMLPSPLTSVGSYCTSLSIRIALGTLLHPRAFKKKGILFLHGRCDERVACNSASDWHLFGCDNECCISTDVSREVGADAECSCGAKTSESPQHRIPADITIQFERAGRSQVTTNCVADRKTGVYW